MQIGAQLYTLRMYTQNEADFARTIARISDMGVTVAQLSAQGPIAPKKIRRICDDYGVRIVLTHSPEARILHDIDALIEEHALLGCRYVGLGCMPERYRSEEWLDCFAEDFRPSAEKLRSAGMKLMYHNHALEFERMSDGRTLMDRLLELLPADLMGVTADTYWLQYGGVPVGPWLAAHADRLHCVHLKDLAPHGFEARMAPVGAGNLDFPGIMRTLNENGVTEYALIEQDDCYGASPFACLKRSLAYLRALAREM